MAANADDEPEAGAEKAAKKTPRKRAKKVAAASRGLTPSEVVDPDVPAAVRTLEDSVTADGGAVVGSYRDPLGGSWQMIVALPIEKVAPTPFQRDVSDAHGKRLGGRIDALDRFLDPIIVVRRDDGSYWTPNGNHRLTAMRTLGARSIVALLVPETEMAYQILSLNTEKAHNLKEKSLEVIRMARDLAGVGPESEVHYAEIFEDPTFLTLGACYELRARYAGSAYQPILKRVDGFLDQSLSETIPRREARAARLLELDDAVADAVKALKEKGLESPYLKNFVVARVNPLRFSKKQADFDETLDTMLEKARSFDAGKVKPDQLAKTGGGGGE